HGHRELRHPETGFYAIGAKSYGRAPNFLMATGYQQARSVVAALAGDLAAADDVQLELPQTGVCSTDLVVGAEAGAASACCGGPAKELATACCALDEQKKSEGEAGCGCAAPAKPKVEATKIQATSCLVLGRQFSA
ncbi:MAG TPA: flavoprotein, partial [Burkholderiales bacterium]|nr:flavoprotein [Burkholderiales bacterium]